MAEPLLSLRDINITFGGVKALKNVAFEEGVAGVVIFVGGRDPLRQPVGMCSHPAELAAFE